MCSCLSQTGPQLDCRAHSISLWVGRQRGGAHRPGSSSSSRVHGLGPGQPGCARGSWGHFQRGGWRGKPQLHPAAAAQP